MPFLPSGVQHLKPLGHAIRSSVRRSRENPTPSAWQPGSGAEQVVALPQSPVMLLPSAGPALPWDGGGGRCMPTSSRASRGERVLLEVARGRQAGCVPCLPRPLPRMLIPARGDLAHPSLWGFCHMKGFPNLYIGRK